MGIINTYNLAVGGAIAVMTAILGDYWFLFMAFLVFNIFDWITGWYKARKLKKESSIEGARGIVKKLFYWMLIATAFITATVLIQLGNKLGIDLSFATLLGWFVLASLLINEIRSIVENFVEIGMNVPDVIQKGLAVADLLINKKSGESVPSDDLESVYTDDRRDPEDITE